MIEQKFYEGEKILFKTKYFEIVSVSKIFKNKNIGENDIRKWIPHGNKSELINYFVVAKKGKSYLSFVQDRMENAKIVTEGKMYANIHWDLPKRKKSPGKFITLL